VRRAGQNLRITAQLIDGSTDAHLWAEKYGGTLDDVFDLQEELSRRIVEALKGTLTPDEERQLGTRATDDPRVYEVWMRARQVGFSLTREGIEEGMRIIAHGLQSFGDRALLHAANAVFLFFLYDFGFSSDEKTLNRCADAATRALEMNPNLPQAWYAKGLSVYKQGNTPEGVRHLRRVLELERNGDALWLLAHLLAEAGMIDEARAYAEEAMERDPLIWTTRFSRAVVDVFAGEFEAAVAGFTEQAERGMADPAFSHWWLGQALAYAGEDAAAVVAFEKGYRERTGLFSELCELGVRAFRGEQEGLREWFDSNEVLQEAVMRDEAYPRYVGQCFARVGEFDEVLRWLDQATEWGFTNHHFLAEHDRGLIPLRGDPRFSALLDRARQKQRAFEA
jgi:adenylate cyclase